MEFRTVCPAEGLSRVDVLLHTAQIGTAATITLRILDPDGSLLRIFRAPARRLRGFQKFIFPLIKGLENKDIFLQLSCTPSSAGSRVIAWVYPEAPELGFACRLYSVAGPPKAFPLIYEDPDTKVKIWENPGAAPRLFLAPEASVASSWKDALRQLKDTPDLTRQVWLVEGSALASTWTSDLAPGKVLAFHLDPNDVSATFEAYTPGILTLTDSYSPGWRAFLNGQEVPILLVDGLFRGVRLDNPGIYKLHYSYRPPHWNLSVVFAIFGFLLIMGGSFANHLKALISSFIRGCLIKFNPEE